MTTFETLLAEADARAQAADWQGTFETLSRASLIQPRQAGVIAGLGTCLLQLGETAQALPYFQQAAALEPASPDAHNNLGVACLLAGDLPQAEAACRQALAQDAQHLPAWRNLAMACLRQGRAPEGVTILASLVQTHPEDLEAMLLLARCYAQAGDAGSARFLYRRVLDQQPDLADARAGLAALEPQAATASNAPVTARVARTEHAGKLARLRAPAPAKAAGPANPPPTASLPAATTAAVVAAPRSPSVAFYGPAEVSLGVRVGVPASALHQAGYRVTAGLFPSAGPINGYDVYVFSRPQLTPEAIRLIEQCRQAGARVVVDLDDDFHHLPPDHPGYPNVGPGNPASLHLLEQAIGGADLLVTATPVLAERYAARARRVAVVPNGWDKANSLWDTPGPRHTTLNIGWAGTMTHRSDFALVRPALVRLARERPEVQIVIGGDPEVYESLSALPESRRLFLPMATYDDYPYLLAYFDIVLAPLRDNPFNQAKSDIKLLEAGIRRIPWVASPRTAYQAWGAGGLLAEGPDEWYAALRQLAGAPAMRQSLGAEGRAKAETRESRQLALAWEAALASLAL